MLSNTHPRDEPIPADQPPVIPGNFDRVVHAVEDMHLDPHGNESISSRLESELNDGHTLVEFPPGEYLVNRPVQCSTDGIGIRSTTGNAEDVVFRYPTGSNGHFFKGVGSYPRDLYLASFTIDRLVNRNTSIGLVEGNWRDRAYIHDIRVPGSSDKSDQLLIWNVRDSGALPNGPQVLVDGIVKQGPTTYTEYPQGEITIYMGPPTEGNITYRRLNLHNTTESAIYCGKDNAAVHVVDSYFENCMHTAIRVAGNESSIRNCSILLDLANGHPENRNALGRYVRDPNNRQPQVQRGIWCFTNVHKREGPGIIEECDVYLASDDGYGHGDTEYLHGEGGQHKKISGIIVASDTGGTRIRNCRIYNENPTATSIRGQPPNEMAAARRSVHVEGCQLTNRGSGTPIDIDGRAGSSVVKTAVDHDGRTGIEVSGHVESCVVSGGTSAVTAGSMDRDSISDNPTPDAPDLSSWTGSHDDSYASDDYAGRVFQPDEEETRMAEFLIRIEQTSESANRNTYEFEIDSDGVLEAGDDPDHGEIPVGNTVTGAVGPARGVDEFYASGTVERFEIHEPQHATVTIRYVGEDAAYADVPDDELVWEMDASKLGETFPLASLLDDVGTETPPETDPEPVPDPDEEVTEETGTDEETTVVESPSDETTDEESVSESTYEGPLDVRVTGIAWTSLLRSMVGDETTLFVPEGAQVELEFHDDE